MITAIAVLLLGLIYVVFSIYKSVVVCRKDKSERSADVSDGVSVIITAHNAAEALKKNLVGFLIQDYPHFEVIVVDECSEDETAEMIALFQQDYPQLKYTRIFPGTKFRFTKKLALNIGVLAAQYDIVLFSEPHCYPSSSQWIRTMRSYFTPDTAVVTGLANYKLQKGAPFFYNWRRLFRLTRFLEMVWAGCCRKFIFGEGCNFGYRKSYYLDNRGYTRNAQSYLGYDNDIVRDLSKYGKVKVLKDQETLMFVDTEVEEDVNEVSFYFASKIEIPPEQRLLLSGEKVIRLLLYIGLLILYLMDLPLWLILSVAFVPFLMDMIVINCFTKNVKQKKIFLPSLLGNMIGFAYRWYWNVYSFFNRKKWR